jgi:hypothetical protein
VRGELRILFIRRYLEIRLMSYAVNMFKNEHSSLLGVMEQSATAKTLAIHIHPE